MMRHPRTLAPFVPLALLLALTPALAQDQDPHALLGAALDRLRGPAMVATYTLEVERPNRSKTYVLRVYTDGGDRSLIEVVEPRRDAGQAFLTVGEDIWVYNPRLGRVLRLPPSGRNDRFLGSDVSYADLAGRDLERYYEVTLEPSTGTSQVLTLRLVPKPRAPTPWGAVVMVLERDTLLPRKILYYDQRGAVAKEVRLEDAVDLGDGRYLVTKTTVTDRTRTGYRTVFTVSDWKVGPVPEACFTPEALERGCRL